MTMGLNGYQFIFISLADIHIASFMPIRKASARSTPRGSLSATLPSEKLLIFTTIIHDLNAGITSPGISASLTEQHFHLLQSSIAQ